MMLLNNSKVQTSSEGKSNRTSESDNWWWQNGPNAWLTGSEQGLSSTSSSSSTCMRRKGLASTGVSCLAHHGHNIVSLRTFYSLMMLQFPLRPKTILSNKFSSVWHRNSNHDHTKQISKYFYKNTLLLLTQFATLRSRLKNLIMQKNSLHKSFDLDIELRAKSIDVHDIIFKLHSGTSIKHV